MKIGLSLVNGCTILAEAAGASVTVSLTLILIRSSPHTQLLFC